MAELGAEYFVGAADAHHGEVQVFRVEGEARSFAICDSLYSGGVAVIAKHDADGMREVAEYRGGVEMKAA